MKPFFRSPAAVFALIYAWKIALLVFSAQPVPSNDAFFYDGPVVNLLLYGKYANPPLALALPISGTEIFSAYPPLYQLVLLGWMALFGTSAMAAMVFHLLLFGICLLLLLAIFRQLQLSAWIQHVAAAFLLVITFHDRPDSLAHVFGIAAIYAWVRSRDAAAPRATRARNWKWMMAGLAVLSLCTGLQIGCVYFLVLWLAEFSASFFGKEPFPLLPMCAMLAVPAALLALVIFGFPRLWEGFLEHARQTPSLTGLRRPGFGDLLKAGRTVPGILGVALFLPILFKRSGRVGQGTQRSLWLCTTSCALAGLTIMVASLFVLTPNSVLFASWLQPIVVAGGLALVLSTSNTQLLLWQTGLLLVAALLGAIRAIGMSTWGLACAADVGYAEALQQVRQRTRSEANLANPAVVVCSAAYLYETVSMPQIRAFHSDWLLPSRRGGAFQDREALLALKPSKLILTQFDFYRRYEPVLAELKSHPDLVDLQISNSAKVRPPDSYRTLQKVVQHVSWAPVVVTFSWK